VECLHCCIVKHTKSVVQSDMERFLLIISIKSICIWLDTLLGSKILYIKCYNFSVISFLRLIFCNIHLFDNHPRDEECVET
jgi:hypothetical protein